MVRNTPPTIYSRYCRTGSGSFSEVRKVGPLISQVCFSQSPTSPLAMSIGSAPMAPVPCNPPEGFPPEDRHHDATYVSSQVERLDRIAGPKRPLRAVSSEEVRSLLPVTLLSQKLLQRDDVFLATRGSRAQRTVEVARFGLGGEETRDRSGVPKHVLVGGPGRDDADRVRIVST